MQKDVFHKVLTVPDLLWDISIFQSLVIFDSFQLGGSYRVETNLQCKSNDLFLYEMQQTMQFTVFNKLQCWKTIWKFSQHAAGVVVAIFPIRYSSTNKKFSEFF